MTLEIGSRGKHMHNKKPSMAQLETKKSPQVVAAQKKSPQVVAPSFTCDTYKIFLLKYVSKQGGGTECVLIWVPAEESVIVLLPFSTGLARFASG